MDSYLARLILAIVLDARTVCWQATEMYHKHTHCLSTWPLTPIEWQDTKPLSILVWRSSLWMCYFTFSTVAKKYEWKIFIEVSDKFEVIRDSDTYSPAVEYSISDVSFPFLLSSPWSSDHGINSNNLITVKRNLSLNCIAVGFLRSLYKLSSSGQLQLAWGTTLSVCLVDFAET